MMIYVMNQRIIDAFDFFWIGILSMSIFYERESLIISVKEYLYENYFPWWNVL